MYQKFRTKNANGIFNEKIWKYTTGSFQRSKVNINISIFFCQDTGVIVKFRFSTRILCFPFYYILAVKGFNKQWVFTLKIYMVITTAVSWPLHKTFQRNDIYHQKMRIYMYLKYNIKEYSIQIKNEPEIDYE